MKKFLSILLALLQFQMYGNMANPVAESTLGTRPFVSEYIEVIQEDLLIKVSEQFDFTSFNIKYDMDTAQDGFQFRF